MSTHRLLRPLVAAALVAGSVATGAAQLASRSTAEWIKVLDSPDRIAGLHVDDVVARVALRPGETVADIGAGTGIFSFAMAQVVGPAGKIYAVEVDRGLVDHLRAKAESNHTGNVRAILGQFGDPSLPASDVDVAFFHDALHHIAERQAYLARLVTYLKPTARIAIVEMDPVRGAHSNDPALQISKTQLNAWMGALGFEPTQQADLSPEKWFAMYARPR